MRVALQLCVVLAALTFAPRAHGQGVLTPRSLTPHTCSDDHASPDAVIESCTQLLESSDHLSAEPTTRALVGRGVAYFEKGELDAALADLDRAVSISPADYLAHYNRGNVRLAQHNYDQAFTDYDRAVGLSGNPNDWQVLYGRCSSLYALKRYGEAIRDCGRAIGINPRQSDVFYLRGAAYLAAGDDREALTDMQRAVWLAPDSSSAMLGLAGAYEHTGDFERAIALSDRAAATAGQAEAHRPADLDMAVAALASRCLSRAEAKRDLQAALGFCNEAISRDAESFDARASRGLAQLQLGANQQAWDDFDAAVNHDSDDSWSLYGRGLAALRLGRADEGHADLAAAIAKEGDLAQTYGRYGIAAN